MLYLRIDYGQRTFPITWNQYYSTIESVRYVLESTMSYIYNIIYLDIGS